MSIKESNLLVVTKKVCFSLSIIIALCINNLKAEEIEIISDNGINWDYKNNIAEFFGPVSVKSKRWSILAGAVKSVFSKDKKVKYIYASKNVKLFFGDLYVTSPNIDYQLENNTFTFSGKQGKRTWEIRSFLLSSLGKGELNIKTLKFSAENSIRFKDKSNNFFGSADKVSISFYKSSISTNNKTMFLISTIHLVGSILLRIDNSRFSGSSLMLDIANKTAKLCGNALWVWNNVAVTSDCYTFDIPTRSITSNLTTN